MNKYIVADPDILGGTPVIKGTRIPVERILYLFKQGYTIDDIHGEYDHVGKSVLERVLDELTQAIENKSHEPQASPL